MPVIITHPETHATSNLQRGDLVFKNCEGSLEVGKVIQAGQFLSSLFGQAQIKDSKWEHAAVAINAEGSLIEAVSGGITVNDMTRGADYIVFRCSNPAVQNVAANAAQMFLENKLEGEILQRALLNKVGVQRQMKDAAGAIRTLERIVGIEAKSEAGAAAQSQLEELRGIKPGGEAKP